MRGKLVSDEEFAARHAVRLNYVLVEILARKTFLVKCLTCGTQRQVSSTNSHLYGSCPVKGCKPKRKSVVLRTPEVHTAELKAAGYAEYICVSVGGQGPAHPHTYEHSCGNRFVTRRQTFMKSKMEPCPKCRKTSIYSNDDYLKIMRKFRSVIVPIEPYQPLSIAPRGIKHRYVECGHVTRIKPNVFTCHTRDIRVCKVCHKSCTWYRFRYKDRVFQTRSLIEKRFIKFLVEKGIDISRIEYEPMNSRVTYYHPVSRKDRTYIPDFKVGEVRFEVKSLASLGLKPYKWLTPEEALIENRAKAIAATRAFADYRIYVYEKGQFHRVRKFWTRKEQTRLLSI